MGIVKYLAAVWTAILIYSVFSFFAGSRGLAVYNQLLSERELQWANLKELGNINEELERVKNNLLYDDDTMLIQARQMGYGQDDEQYVRIVGLGKAKNTYVATGKVYLANEPDFFSDRFIKITALCAALAVFALLFAFEFAETRNR
jgi:cell division protein FtsB